MAKIEQFTETERQVLTLKEDKGLSFFEIGQLYGVDWHLIRKYHTNAVRKLLQVERLLNELTGESTIRLVEGVKP